VAPWPGPARATRPWPAAEAVTYLADAYRRRSLTRYLSAADTAETTGVGGIARAMRDDPSRRPGTPRRLVGACAWAAAVGLVGLVLAAWSAMEVLVGAPDWFLPASAAVGLAGVASTVAALSIARRALTPWFLLGLATCALGAAVYLIQIADAARAVAAP
jgi:hypothetical protein